MVAVSLEGRGHAEGDRTQYLPRSSWLQAPIERGRALAATVGYRLPRRTRHMPVTTDWVRYGSNLGYLAWPDRAASARRRTRQGRQFV